MNSVLATAAPWLVAFDMESHTSPTLPSAHRHRSNRDECRRLRRTAAVLFLAAGRMSRTAGPLCQALFTDRANGWLATGWDEDTLAERFLESWPRAVDDGTNAITTLTGENDESHQAFSGGLSVLHVPGDAPANMILRAAAANHPNTVREVVVQQPTTSVTPIVHESTVDLCVAAWAPHLVVWSVLTSGDRMHRDTVTALYRGGCPNLEVLSVPVNPAEAAVARREVPSGGDMVRAGDVLHDAEDAIVPLARLTRVILYNMGLAARCDLPSRNLSRFAPRLRELVFDRSLRWFEFSDFPASLAAGCFPHLSALGGCLPMNVERAFLAAAGSKRASREAPRAVTTQPPLRLLEITDLTERISDLEVVKAVAACMPNLCHVSVTSHDPAAGRTLGTALTSLRQLRRLEFVSSIGIDCLDDAILSKLLRVLPCLAVLDISAWHHFPMSVTFAPAALKGCEGVVYSAMRELRAARRCGIRKEGLEAIVRMFPQLRTLDVRGCFGLSLNNFSAVMLESHSTDTAPATATTGVGSRQTRLRLRKLRRVVASYRRRVPKALNFIEYHCGNYGTVEARELASAE